MKLFTNKQRSALYLNADKVKNLIELDISSIDDYLKLDVFPVEQLFSVILDAGAFYTNSLHNQILYIEKSQRSADPSIFDSSSFETGTYLEFIQKHVCSDEDTDMFIKEISERNSSIQIKYICETDDHEITSTDDKRILILPDECQSEVYFKAV